MLKNLNNSYQRNTKNKKTLEYNHPDNSTINCFCVFPFNLFFFAAQQMLVTVPVVGKIRRADLGEEDDKSTWVHVKLVLPMGH